MNPSNVIAARVPRGEARPLSIIRDPDLLASVLEDAAHYPGGAAAGLVSPETEADVAAAMRHGGPVLPIGAQSSLTGGATPRGELVLSTARLAGCTTATDSVRVGAGVTIESLRATLSALHLLYPPAPTYLGACAGGVIATNAAGPATFKYGTTRDWVAGLTVVLPSGEVIDIERGQHRAHPDGYFEFIDTSGRVTRVPVKALTHPAVPKCSAGYALAREMDLVDLFVGSEGTLGVVTGVTFRLLRNPPAELLVLLGLPSEEDGIELARALREEAHRTWRTRDPRGLDVSAIEHADARAIALVAEHSRDNTDVRSMCESGAWLFVDVDLPADTRGEQVWQMIADALEPGAADTPLSRFCRLLDQRGLLDRARFALPGDGAERGRLLALREAIPEAVNHQVALARQRLSGDVSKTAGDFIAPFERFGEMVGACRAACASRSLDLAIWGHISDGNIHPNVIPRQAGDVARGREALLEAGRAVMSLGGSPLAEHGVGRNPVKQQFLRMVRGDAGIEAMWAVKRALDPAGILAPGVLLSSSG